MSSSPFQAMQSSVATRRPRSPMATPLAPSPLHFDEVYEQWFDEVFRWLRALSGSPADAEDLAQDVFLVVRRKLPTFDGANLAGWLYRIAARAANDRRRRAWFKNIFSRRREIPLEELRDDALGPLELVERRQAQRMLMMLVGKMNARRRETFVLFEIEGYSIEEISLLQAVPSSTVRTRLHHARKELFKLARHYRNQESL